MKQLALTFPGTTGTIDENISDISTGGIKVGGSWFFSNLTKPADIINVILPFIFVIAGLILFFMLIAGGFTIFTSIGNPEKIKKGTGMITSALIGFFIIFAAYWILQLLEYTFGLKLISP